MSLASRAGDLYYTFRFIKILTTPWKDSEAVKLGILDERGKRIKSRKITSSEEKDAYTTFHRLAYNIKRLTTNSAGQSSFGSYAAALLLLREHYSMSDQSLTKMTNAADINIIDVIAEANHWFVLEDGCLARGVYKLKEDKLDISLNEGIYAKDKIRVPPNAYPVDQVMGHDIYQVEHIATKRLLYVTAGEILR